MSSPPAQPSVPSTPLTPRARENLMPALVQLAEAIAAKDDDTPANKLRHTLEFLHEAAARIDVPLAPIPAPVFAPEKKTSVLVSAAKTATPKPASPDNEAGEDDEFSGFGSPSPTVELTIQPSNKERLLNQFKEIADKYAPGGSSVPDSPASEAFADKETRIIVQMNISRTVSGDDVREIRTQFQTELENAQFTLLKNNVPTNSTFVRVEVRQIVGEIFQYTFNNTGCERARAIINSYRNSHKRGNPPSAGMIAGRLALNDALPREMRLFYQVFATSSKHNSKSTPVDEMILLYEKYRLYNSYLALCKPSVPVAEVMRDAGFFPSQGRSWSTVVKGYISQELQLSKEKLANVLQESQGIHLLVHTFGLGVLALVRKGIMNFLTRLGVQKLQLIGEIATRVGLVRATKGVCVQAEKSIVLTIVNGNHLPELHMDNADPGNLLEAVTPVFGGPGDDDSSKEDVQKFAFIDDAMDVDEESNESSQEEDVSQETELEENDEGESDEGESDGGESDEGEHNMGKSHSSRESSDEEDEEMSDVSKSKK